MTDPELKDFAELWQQEPSAEEHAMFEEAARKVRRRAQFLDYADFAFAVVIVAGMSLGFLLQPGAYSAVIAGLLIVAIVWLSIKRRAVRQMAKTLDTTNREAFIESSIRNVTASVRRVLLSLWFLPLGVLLAVLFKLDHRSGGHLEQPLAALAAWAVSTRGVILLTGMAIIIGFLLRALRKCRAEMRELEELRSVYRKATLLDDSSDG